MDERNSERQTRLRAWCAKWESRASIDTAERLDCWPATRAKLALAMVGEVRMVLNETAPADLTGTVIASPIKALRAEARNHAALLDFAESLLVTMHRALDDGRLLDALAAALAAGDVEYIATGDVEHTGQFAEHICNELGVYEHAYDAWKQSDASSLCRLHRIGARLGLF